MVVLNIENINLLFFCLLEASFKIHLAQKSLNGHDASDDQDNVSKCIDIVSNTISDTELTIFTVRRRDWGICLRWWWW